MVREIPLHDSGNPASAMANNARIFKIPLADRLPQLHEFAAVKGEFDEEVIRLLAPELNDYEGTRAKDAILPSRDPKLFAASFRYECHSYLDTANIRIYYEVIQATERLQFRTVARLRWLISDAVGRASLGRESKVVILVGNLESTHYSETTKSGEILVSVEKLRKDLRPAIEAGLVEVRVHSFTQDNAIRLTRTQS